MYRIVTRGTVWKYHTSSRIVSAHSSYFHTEHHNSVRVTVAELFKNMALSPLRDNFPLEGTLLFYNLVVYIIN